MFMRIGCRCQGSSLLVSLHLPNLRAGLQLTELTFLLAVAAVAAVAVAQL